MLFGLIAGAVLLLMAVGGYWGFREWSAPYALPELPEGLTLADVGLDVSRERAVWRLWQRRRGEEDPQADPRLPAEPTPTADPALAQLQFEAGWFLLQEAGDDPKVRARGLAYLQAAVRSDPTHLLYGNALRRAMQRLELYAEAPRWWEALAAEAAASAGEEAPWQVRLQWALSYVDAMADRSLGEARIGQLSLQSIGVLDGILAEEPYNWVARYARGLNNLYWPLGMKRYAKALSDLEFAVALGEAVGANAAIRALSWTAYGDARVKAGEVAQGMRIWREAARRFPEHEPLRRRAAARSAEEARALVREERGLEGFHRPDPNVTDLSPLWEE